MFTPIRYTCVSALLVIAAAASANGQTSESPKNRCSATAPDTGCLHWTFKAAAQVRTAISIGLAGNAPAIFFGDQQANAYGVDATTGALLWKVHVDDHPAARITGAPTLANGRLYVPTSSSEEGLAANPMYPCCTFRGSLSALDAATGAVIWKSYTIQEAPKPVRKNKTDIQLSGPSGAAIWSSPTVDLDGGMVFVTTGDSYSDPVASTSDAFIAFDLKTGKLLWSRQMTSGDAFTVDCDFPDAIKANCPMANGPDFDFGSSAVLVSLGTGKRALIAGQKSGFVHAIDPDRGGEILWQRKIGQGDRIGGIQWGMSADANYIYAALSDVAIVPPLPDGTGGRPTMFGIPAATRGPAAARLSQRRRRRFPASCFRADSTAICARTTPGAAGSPGTSTRNTSSPRSTASRPTADRSTAPAQSSSTACCM
jgi:polyvinyl alcohol dehydrogenase (cytochrome)